MIELQAPSMPSILIGSMEVFGVVPATTEKIMGLGGEGKLTVGSRQCDAKGYWSGLAIFMCYYS